MQSKYAMLLIVAVAIGLLVYTFVDPAFHLFPKCPVFKYTGFKCPGCGSQRAMHQLLNGNIKSAFFYNPLLVISIPYLLVGFAFNNKILRTRYPKFRYYLFGPAAIKISLVIILAFTILRNVSSLH